MNIRSIAQRTYSRLARIGDERGASLVEYALLVALIAVVCVVAVSFFGGETSNSFSRAASEVGNS